MSRDSEQIPFSGISIMHAIEPRKARSINQHMKFVIPSFTDSNMTGGPNLNYGSRDPDHAY